MRPHPIPVIWKSPEVKVGEDCWSGVLQADHSSPIPLLLPSALSSNLQHDHWKTGSKICEFTFKAVNKYSSFQGLLLLIKISILKRKPIKKTFLFNIKIPIPPLQTFYIKYRQFTNYHGYNLKLFTL